MVLYQAFFQQINFIVNNLLESVAMNVYTVGNKYSMKPITTEASHKLTNQPTERDISSIAFVNGRTRI